MIVSNLLAAIVLMIAKWITGRNVEAVTLFVWIFVKPGWEITSDKVQRGFIYVAQYLEVSYAGFILAFAATMIQIILSFFTEINFVWILKCLFIGSMFWYYVIFLIDIIIKKCRNKTMFMQEIIIIEAMYFVSTYISSRPAFNWLRKSWKTMENKGGKENE